MDKIAMLNGLSGKDFSALGTILATAATGAAVHGLMYPMTEFVYGLSDNFIKNVIPNNWRKPLPQGYRPQTIKIDKPNFKDKNKEWDEIRKVMDQLDGEQLRGFTLTLSPEYINDAYRYLVAIRGINPGDENKPYLSIFKNIGLNFSENNEPSSEEKEPSSEEKEPSSKENKLFDEKLDKMKNLGGAAGVAALVGAGTLAMSPVYKEEDRSKNRRRALRNALIGGGLYYLAKNAGLKGSGESTSGESTSGDKSEEDEDDDEDEAEKWFKDHLYTKDYISEDQESDNPKHLGYTWNGSPIYGPTWDKDMSMLNGLFGKSKSSKFKYPIIQNQINETPNKGWFYGDVDPEEIKEYGFKIPEGYKARYDEDDYNPGNYYLVKKDRSNLPKVTHEQAEDAWRKLSNDDRWKFFFDYSPVPGREPDRFDISDCHEFIDDPEWDSDIVDYYNKNYI